MIYRLLTLSRGNPVAYKNTHTQARVSTKCISRFTSSTRTAGSVVDMPTHRVMVVVVGREINRLIAHASLCGTHVYEDVETHMRVYIITWMRILCVSVPSHNLSGLYATNTHTPDIRSIS